MQLTGFILRTRHLFGFLVPGALWTAAIYEGVLRQMIRAGWAQHSLLALLEGGNIWIRTAGFLAISSALGFAIQTLLWPIVVDQRRKRWHLQAIESRKDVLQALRAKYSSKIAGTPWPYQGDEDLGFWKLFVLEHSRELKHLVLEKEDDINLLVAMTAAAPGLLILGAITLPIGTIPKLSFVALAIGCVFGLRAQVERYLRRERQEWIECAFALAIASKDVTGDATKTG